jgi:hypothetical protein
MKKIRLEPLGEVVALPTGRRLLDALHENFLDAGDGDEWLRA